MKAAKEEALAAVDRAIGLLSADARTDCEAQLMTVALNHVRAKILLIQERKRAAAGEGKRKKTLGAMTRTGP